MYLGISITKIILAKLSIWGTVIPYIKCPYSLNQHRKENLNTLVIKVNDQYDETKTYYLSD